MLKALFGMFKKEYSTEEYFESCRPKEFVDSLWTRVSADINRRGVELHLIDPSEMNGYRGAYAEDSNTRYVFISNKLEGMERVYTLMHEYRHVMQKDENPNIVKGHKLIEGVAYRLQPAELDADLYACYCIGMNPFNMMRRKKYSHMDWQDVLAIIEPHITVKDLDNYKKLFKYWIKRAA